MKVGAASPRFHIEAHTVRRIDRPRAVYWSAGRVPSATTCNPISRMPRLSR